MGARTGESVAASDCKFGTAANATLVGISLHSLSLVLAPVPTTRHVTGPILVATSLITHSLSSEEAVYSVVSE